MARTLALTILLAAVLAAPAAAAVRREGIDEHLRALADIAAQNGNSRAAATPGDAATAEYLGATLGALGYDITFQTFDFAYFEERRPPVLGDLRHGRDFVTARQSGSGTGVGRVRSIRGSGGCRTRDFGALRRGELAAVVGGDCTLERVARNAERAGAAAMLLEDSSRPLPLALRPVLRLPVLQVERRRLHALARSGRPVEVSVDAFRERRTTRNVIAERGSGPRVVMAGAHHDSVPEGPGINDNGSGVAALLEIAEQLAASPPRGATIRLGFWAAEEWGLFGSRAYVRSLSRAQRRRIAGYLNVDMVASPNAVQLVYGTRWLRRELHKAVGLAAVVTGGSSDDGPFATAGIPAAGIYTGATEIKRRDEERQFGGRARRPMDPCYHRACDAVQNANTRWATRAANATLRVLRRLATRRAAR